MKEEYILLPKKLTAENGAKALLIGEFYHQKHFTDHDGSDVSIDIVVPWHVIKEIYSKIVEELGKEMATNDPLTEE